MKNIKSIVPLLPAQQLMLAATLKDKKELYVQQLLFEVNGHSKIEIEKALDKLIDSYECFRSLILYEGLKQAVWVSKDDVRPPFNSNQINFSDLFEVIHVIRMKGFNFQKEPCIRFDWITTQEKNFLCITNHHILYDGWGKQVILSDFIRALKYPNSFLIEKLNKSWYEAWSKLDHAYAIDVYSKYLNHFDDFASISQISSLKQENLEHKTKVSVETIQQTSKNLGLTGAELINFCWSIFISSWTQNEHVQFGVVKQNGLIDQVKNGFGMGIQTLPFQFHVDFNASIREQIILFKNRERGISTASFVNSLDPLFSQFKYDFLIAFENYPLDSKLGLVENEFNLLFSYDRSEFPLSLAISPFPNRYELDWHYNTAFHNSNQIIFLANQFITFLESFELNIELSPSELCQKWYRDSNTIKSFKAEYNTDNFIQKLVSNLNKEQRKIHDHFSRHFKTAINCIWIYGDKHESMIPLISAAWSENVEVLTINEKESSSFVTKLLELKKPDLIFSSIEDYRFADSITLNQNLLDLNLKCGSEKMLNNNALSICTSGTTGEPKVVQLNIENIISFFLAWEEKLPWREKEYFAAIAHPAFDIGVAELMFPFWKGWEINLLNKSILSDSILLDQALSGITAFHMVPSLLETWIEQTNSDEQERFIMTGGDKVPPHLYLKLHAKFPNSKLFQFYGPSECSVLASGFENQGQFEKNELPIGTAFNHAALFLFGNKSIPLPPYQEGEIIVSGPAVGVGYASEENSHKFFTFNEHPTFRTGDFGYKDAEGNLFFRGRKDRQLKINGQRIELSRIESALLEWSLIENWVVIPNENMLFAFAKASQKKHPERKKLEHLLPFYAIPQHIEILDEFPLNKNGKVDHQQLLNLGISAIKNIKLSGIINPEIETSIINLFQDKKLNFSIGWYANGLNSIDALKLAGILKTKLNLPIELNQILGTDNLFNLCQVKANSVNQDLNLTVIEEGQKVYSTAARLIFLSESDEQFHKSYWISSGVKIPVGFEIEQIKKWVNVQQNLHLCIAINQSEYYWKKSKVHLHEFDVKNELEFIHEVENTFSDLGTSLFNTFIGKSKEENYLAFKVHHSLLDGLGLELVWEKIHHDLTVKQLSTLELIAPKEDKIDVNFWTNYLKEIEVSKLAFERVNTTSPKVNRIHIELSQEERQILFDLCSTFNCSLFEAGLMLFVKMMSGFKSKNQAIGIPINIGDYVDSNHISAMSVNILPFKTEHGKVEDILVNWRELFKKRFTPFSEIAQLDETQKNGVPFFNCTYLYHSHKSELKDFEPIAFNRSATDFNLALDFVEEKDKFIFSWEYRSDLFSEKAIRTYHQILFYGTKQKEVSSRDNELNLKSKWNEVVQSFSSKTALIFGAETYSYFEIDKSICEIRENFTNSEKIDVLILERNKLSICKLLFYLIDGIPFIPIDAETATDRIEQIHSISKEIKITNSEFKELQYAIATSGTTGIPKLVGVKKTGYESAVNAWINDYEMNNNDCCLQAASFSFDVSLGDIGRCFFNGAKMVLLDSAERKDPTLILDKIKEFSVTVFETTPLIVRWWLSDKICLSEFQYLRLLIVGSDSWKMGELRTLFQTKSENQRIISSYGLSETTIDNSFFDPETDDHIEYPNEMIVPIGKAMNHCELNITDPDGHLLCDGMEGFISIKGPAVGLGYFINGNWTNKQNSIWQSKDRGICDEWGNFHFKGRSDRQVKIRGQRIELEEIEQVLFSIHPKLIWSVFDFEHEFSSEMVAFHVGKIDRESLNQLKSTIVEKYPSYYLPSLFLELDQIPLNTNGKTDVVELRKLATQKNSTSISVRDDSDTMGRLISHFKQCFNEEIVAENNFFQFGKNSFDAMHFVRSWNKLYDEKMAIHQLFSSDNFSSLAQILSIRSNIQKTETKVNKISKAQEAIWFEIKNGNSSLFNLPHFIEIPSSYNLEKIKLAFEQTLKVCPTLFTRFEETELGDVIIQTVNSTSFELEILTIDDLDEFKKNAFTLNFDFTHGLPFEAFIVNYKEQVFLYFNPHHLVYDGGSDAHLSKLFLDFYENRYVQEEELYYTTQNEIISWDTYFQLLTPPEIHFHKANTELQPSLILACNEKENATLKKLALCYQCTQTTIVSHLLSKALHSIGIEINWISLALDHRMLDSVGMHMRAYPFPCFDSKNETDFTIAKQKWAFSQLFAATDQAIIYPDSIPIEAYNQVGLIIQHPFYSPDLKLEKEKIEIARPRLPLSLYVEEINNHLSFRWEFDNDQLTLEKIKKLHQIFFMLAEDLLKVKKEVHNFKPEKEISTRRSLNENILPELSKIWMQYTGVENFTSNHFFESGANSIKALLMLKEIDKTLQIRISPADFFKNPTLDFLNRSTTIAESNNIIWQMNKVNENDELWLLPPIMGYGFIFNTLQLPDTNVLAFNYPLAMGIKNSTRIEEIANELLFVRQAMGKLPNQVTLLGYSMGGLTAFEMAKWLNNQGVRVKKIIILDKTAQPEPGNILKRVHLKSELIEIAKQISTDDLDFERIQTYLKSHEQMIEQYQQSGYLDCPIDIYYCSDGFQENDFLKWQRFTKQKINVIKVENCSHYEIPKIWNNLKIKF